MYESTGERVYTVPIGNMALGGKPSVGQEEASFECRAAFRTNGPLRFCVIPNDGNDQSIEDTVLSQVPLIGDVLEVRS